MRPAPAASGTGGPWCSALVPVLLSELLPGWEGDGWSPEKCGAPATGYWTGECPCGHARDAWLCDEHAGVAGQSGCQACRELEDGPHDCVLTVTREGVPR